MTEEWYGGSMTIRNPGFLFVVMFVLTHVSTSLSKMTALARSIISAFQPVEREKKKELVPSLKGNHTWHFAYIPFPPVVTSNWRGKWESVFFPAVYTSNDIGGHFSPHHNPVTFQSSPIWKLAVFLFLVSQTPTPTPSATTGVIFCHFVFWSLLRAFCLKYFF